MWQEIAIIIIAFILILSIGRKIYTLFKHPDTANTPCQGCSGCPLKEQSKISHISKTHNNPVSSKSLTPPMQSKYYPYLCRTINDKKTQENV